MCALSWRKYMDLLFACALTILKMTEIPYILTITSRTIQIVFQTKEIDTLKKTTGKYIMLKQKSVNSI